jgi:hypothetical protein
MALYEVINPSDQVTIDAPTFEAAALAIILIGNGAYGGSAIDHDGERVPIFLGGGWRTWIKDRFGYSQAEEMLEAHKADVVATLGSACTGSAKDRKLFDAALAAITDSEKRREFLANWDGNKRTSLNQITAWAHRLAEDLAPPPVACAGEGESDA